MLCDCHMHMLLDGEYWRSAIDRHRGVPDIPYIRRVLERYRDLGYTYLRDGGDKWGVGAAARSLAPEYGITYRTPLAPLCKQGCYGSFIGMSWATEKDYVNLVRMQKAQGADFIKIMISGLMDFDRFGVLTQPGLAASEISMLISIAHGEGLRVMAHCNGGDTALAAAQAGVDSIEHGAYMNAEALQAMLENRTVWVPTVSTVANLRGKGRFSEAAVVEILESTAGNLRAFAAMGGFIAPGSDAGAWAVPHGCETEHAHLHKILGTNAATILTAGSREIMNRF